MSRIAVTGSVAYDTIMQFGGRFGDHILPQHTHRISVAFLIDQLERRRGGTAANVAYTLALLGERPLLCAAVGAGDFDDYGAELTALGVDVSTTLRCQGVTTATAFVTTDAAGNQITAFFPGAMSRAAAIDLRGLDGVTEVVVGADASDAMAAHCAQAAAIGARLLFAPAQQIPAMTDEQLRAGLELAWCVAGNEYELRMIEERTGLGVDELRRTRLVARTCGERGSELHGPDGVLAIPAAPVAAVADPTGAGDAYIAGLLRGVRLGFPLDVSGRMAAIAAACCVERPGPQGHRFTVEEFEHRYTASFGAPLSLAG